MKYFVTVCITDQDVGSNLFWHTGLLLSQFDETKKEMEVVDTWGFYSLPKAGAPTSYLVAFLNKYTGLDYDIAGTHGLLIHEEVRYLDRGCGLHGVSFELSEEKFAALQSKCEAMAKGQQDAIDEITSALQIQGKPPEKTVRYAHEQYSRLIFEVEKIKARQENRPSRLKPFEIDFAIGLNGPHLPKDTTYTCKSVAIDLLQGIVTEEQIARLTENGEHPSFPRWSGPTENIYLHTRGPLSVHTKKSGEKVYFRDKKVEGVQLYWTLPPQEFEVEDVETEFLFEVGDMFCDDLKAMVKKLQALDWLFLNAVLPEEHEAYRTTLHKKIVDSYRDLFELCIDYDPRSSEMRVALSLFAMARKDNPLNKAVKSANYFFNSLYMAVIDDWKIEKELPMASGDGDIVDYDEDNNDYDEDNNAVDYVGSNELEALASYLKVEDKKKLCSILGRNYIQEETNKKRTALTLS